MTTNGPDSSAQLAAGRLRFDRYVLDPDRGCLLLDGREIKLRPKTFAVLSHLVENSGRLVSKDELFAAVWPKLAVTDDVLVQSIGELRRELGDDGPRLIKTIPRRGYRFESAVSSIAPDEPFVTDATAGSAVSHDRAEALKPAGGAHPWTWLTTARSGRRGAWSAALALVVLLAVAALLAARSEWRFIGTLRSGAQFSRTAEVGAKPAIAILPFVNQNDDSARSSGLLVLSKHHPTHDPKSFLEPGYLVEEIIEERWGWLEAHMRYYRRPLSSLTEPMVDAGFVIERIVEPRPSEALRNADPEGYEQLCRLPAFIFMRARKAIPDQIGDTATAF
jgi:DNA-binding winged helix-turn-helix (wHTH) protein